MNNVEIDQRAQPGLCRTKFRADIVIGNCLFCVQPRAQARDLKLEFLSSPVQANLSRESFVLAVENLLSSAFTCTNNGGAVSVFCMSMGDELMVEICILPAAQRLAQQRDETERLCKVAIEKWQTRTGSNL